MVTGKTPCDFHLGLQLGDEPTIHYRVACAPTDAKVHVESINLDATGASGNVVVDDNLVQLRGVHGRFAGGDLATDGDLDFRKADWVLNFTTVSVDKVVLHELPAEWREALLPEAIRKLDPDGELTGQAANVARLLGRRHRCKSPERARARSTRRPSPAPRPPSRSGSSSARRTASSHYVTVNPTPRLLAAVLAGGAERRRRRPVDDRAAAAGVEAGGTGRLGAERDWSGRRTAASGARQGRDRRRGLAEARRRPEPAPEYLDIDLGLEDVDLGQLLQRLQFQLPFPLEGRLTFKVHA